MYKRLTASNSILTILAFLHNRFCDYTLLFSIDFSTLLLCKKFHRCSSLSHNYFTLHLCTYHTYTLKLLPIHRADFVECVLPWQPLWCVCDAKLGLVGGGERETRLLLASLEQGSHFFTFWGKEIEFFLSLSWTF